MGHRMPVVALRRGDASVGRGDFVQHKQRLKWKKNVGRKKHGLFSTHGPTRFQEIPHDSARNWEPQFQNATKNFTRKEHRPPPEAPRNTTSYIIRSKCMKSIVPVVTPSPITPALLQTPGLSPLPRYKEQFADEVNEWGVNGYGSMNGLIRVKTDMKGDSDSESDDDRSSHVQSVQQLEQRLDQDLSRFEMVLPIVQVKAPRLEVRLVDQEYHIAQLEEENNNLKERLSSIEQELDDLRTRMHMLEGGSDHCEQGEVFSEKSIGNVTFPRSRGSCQLTIHEDGHPIMFQVTRWGLPEERFQGEYARQFTVLYIQRF